MARFDLDTVTLGALLDDPEVSAIIDKHVPGIAKDPMVAAMKGMQAKQLLSMAAGVIGQARIDAIMEEVSAL